MTRHNTQQGDGKSLMPGDGPKSALIGDQKSNQTTASEEVNSSKSSHQNQDNQSTGENSSSNQQQQDSFKESKIKSPVKEIHPFVYWGQSNTHLSLRVDLLQVRDLKVELSDAGRKLNFSATGIGAHGLGDYTFELPFYCVVSDKYEHHIIERYVLLLFKKVIQPAKWPRLIFPTAKLPWLRFDFDHFADSDSDNISASDEDYDNNLNQGEEEEEEEEDDDNEQDERTSQELRDKHTYEQLKQRQRLVKQAAESSTLPEDTNSQSWRECLDRIEKTNLQKENIKPATMKYDHRKNDAGPVMGGKNSAKQLNYKKTYLFLYNIMMFVMFLKVYIVLLVKLSNGTMDDEILSGAALIIRMLTYTQLLETLHPMLGLVPGGPFMPFLQSIGRLVVNYFLTDTATRLDASQYAHYLFIVWSSIEIIRYPFYALRVFKVNVHLLTWCRYTLFIPLYPMGGFFEAMVLMSTIKQSEKTGSFSVSLPNQANMSFNLPIFLKFYIYALLGPSIYKLMRYMWSQRAKQLKEKED